MILGLVLVSHDFEVDTNVSCEQSTVSPSTGLIFISFDFPALWRSGLSVRVQKSKLKMVG